jgi:hypothetical protein
MPKTRADLRTAIRNLSNTENNTGFITDAFLNQAIEEARQDLYDIIIGSYEHYFVSTTTFTLTGGEGNNAFTLPAGFWKDIGLDRGTGNNRRSVDKLGSFFDRNHPPEREYMIRGDSTLVVSPASLSAGDYTLFYAPELVALTDDTTQLDAIMGRFPLYLELHAAIAAKDKREQDTSSLEARLARQEARARAALAKRSERPGQASRYRQGRTFYGYP